MKRSIKMAKDDNQRLEKLEKQNKKLKKKNKAGGKVIIILLIIIALLAAVMFLFDPFGLGFGAPFAVGGSKGGAGGQASAVTSADTSPAVTEAPATEAPEPDHIEITVSGSTYLYNGSEKTADEIAKMCSDEGISTVIITDDSATQNAIDELSSALRSAGIEMLLPE